jgi:hypothetical protein
METTIESNANPWKEYNPDGRHYIIWRSCKYESTPGEPRPATEGNLPPRLTVRFFVHELRSGEEVRIGEIGIFVDRGRWNMLGRLNNESEADIQLAEAARSAMAGNWEIEPLTVILRKSCEVIPMKINLNPA